MLLLQSKADQQKPPCAQPPGVIIIEGRARAVDEYISRIKVTFTRQSMFHFGASTFGDVSPLPALEPTGGALPHTTPLQLLLDPRRAYSGRRVK